MPHAAKIAVVACEDVGLVEGLRRLPAQPDVREFSSYYDDFERLREFAPSLLFVPDEAVTERDLGALRLLRLALPGVVTVLCLPREREVDRAEIVRAAEARTLLCPYRQQDLAALLSLAGHPAHAASPETFLDLSRGIADEINNPLLFVSGHLQLLESSMDEERDRDRIEQCGMIRQGLERIGATMGKIRLLGRARSGVPPTDRLPVLALLEDALAASGSAADALQVFVPDDLADLEVRGERDLLTAALAHLLAVGAELRPLCERVDVLVERLAGGARIRTELSGIQLADWQLPRAFEPYYLNRILRGTAHGLSLFLVQTIVHAHGGQAFARRRADGTVLIDLLLAGEGSAAAGGGGGGGGGDDDDDDDD